MYTSATDKRLKTGMAYLAASIVIASAAAIYGLFSHGVYSYYMTYAFMIPMLAGALPNLIAAMKSMRVTMEESVSETPSNGEKAYGTAIIPGAADMQLALIATLTAGSLLKGALDIYGTTNRLMLVYPVAAAVLLAAYADQRRLRSARVDAIPTSMPAAIPLNRRTGK